jgi:hypothetical protein
MIENECSRDRRGLRGQDKVKSSGSTFVRQLMPCTDYITSRSGHVKANFGETILHFLTALQGLSALSLSFRLLLGIQHPLADLRPKPPILL